MTLIIGSIQLGLIYGLLALGITITYRVLNLPDLTADGSFTFGLAVSAALTIAGHPWLAIAAGTAAGALAGLITGLLQTRLKVQPILAGVLTMSGLYSINLLVLGSRSNLSLIGQATIFTVVRDRLPGIDREIVQALVALVWTAVAAAVLYLLFRTQLGLRIRAVGDNSEMVRASSINVEVTQMIALAIANACVAASGAVIAQYQGYADISSGIGTIVVGLASVVIGESLFGHRTVIRSLLAAVTGSILYRLILALALSANFLPTYLLKFISAVIVAVALAIPEARRRLALSRKRKEALRDA